MTIKRVTWKARPDLLLHPNIPKPLHQVNPRSILGPIWWDKTRDIAYRKTAYHCAACGVWKKEAQFRQWLEAHETYEVDYAKGRAVYIETVSLCHCCHNYIHSGRLQTLLEFGKVSHQKYCAIIEHGDKVLTTAGLPINRPQLLEELGEVAPWDKWRLVLDGKLYKPKFKNIQEWENAHRQT